ncbi:MAG: NUDIX hydrolase [Rickettsiaceae bacterium]|nr:NUDIX hydrolase [Rickettsiaceae bacterium]
MGHITASAFLINSDASKFLLMHHKKINLWLQPGGHCDGEVDVLNTAIKEAREESGIEHIKPVNNQLYDIDIHPIPSYKNVLAHEHFDVRFLLQTVSSDELVKNDESLELRWIDFNTSIPDSFNLAPSIYRMIEKYKLYSQIT